MITVRACWPLAVSEEVDPNLPARGARGTNTENNKRGKRKMSPQKPGALARSSVGRGKPWWDGSGALLASQDETHNAPIRLGVDGTRRRGD